MRGTAVASLGVLALALLPSGLGARAAAHAPRHAQAAAPASESARRFAAWVAASGDSHGLAFVIVDKAGAQVSVFSPDGRLRGASPALLGQARGDDSAPGVGQRPLAAILPADRTTPAGRFLSSLGNDLGEKDVVWVDYDAAISLHRVVTGNVREHRLQRLATATTADNRISYGCINVPARFFDTVVRPAFTGANGVVYILPEVRAMQDVFPAYRGG